MTRYAQNGGLTRFDEGKSHQENPLGGIPIGNNNSVEENETKQNNFVYSNRIFLDSNIVSQYNLPKSLVGKSVADATKFIDNKFKGRNDKISQSTKNGMLFKIAEAQEAMKPAEPEMEQSQEGMIDPTQMAFGGYVNRQMSGGGWYDQNNPYFMNNPGVQQSGIGPMNQIQPVSQLSQANSLSQIKPSAIGNQLSTSGAGDMSSMASMGANAAMPGMGEIIEGGKAVLGGIGNIAGSLMSKSKVDTSGIAPSAKVDSSGDVLKQGLVSAISNPSPSGMIKTLFSTGAGLITAGKDKKAALKNSNNFARRTNAQFSDQYAMGGPTDPPKKIKNADGSYSTASTTTRQLTPGSAGTTIPGTPGSPAVLPSAGGVNSTDPGRNKAFAQARAAGLPTFNYNGKLYNTDIKLATPGKPAVNPTPDVITPSVPPTYETNTVIEPIPNQVYNVQAQRGTAGTGVLRPGIGGGITTDNQYTANKDVATRALNAQQNYNANVNRRYAPVIDDGRSNNSAQLANRNAKAELRRQQLQGTATANEIPTQLGLERKKVEALKNNQPLAYGGKMNQLADGGNYYENLILTNDNRDPNYSGFDIANAKRLPIKSIMETSGLKPVNATTPYTIGTQPKVDISNANRQFTSGPSFGRQVWEGTKDTGKFINNNAGNIARYAPIAANALQLAMLKKPQGERLDRLSNRYRPEYVDEAQLQNIANQTMNNSINAVGQSGASQGQLRSSIIGSQLQRTKAISDAYSQAAAQNRQQNAMAQEFNLGVDQVNLQQSNTEKDINARNQGAYDTEKSKLIGKIGENIGNVGNEQAYKKIAITTTGYNWLAEYQKANPTATAEEAVTAAKKAGVIVDDAKTAKKNALGGYLIKNKVK